MRLGLAVFAALTVFMQAPGRERLLNPADPVFSQPAPGRSLVRLETTAGDVVIEVLRDWAPRGADRFVQLARHGYYDHTPIFRIRPGTWAQFGIAADPRVAQAWRHQVFPDDPFRQTNARGTVAFAFAVPHGRATQVFINLRDNASTHDTEPFVPFGRIVEGLDVADRFNAEYGEGLGGIRAGRQDPAFAEGAAFFRRVFPRLDWITRATVTPRLP